LFINIEKIKNITNSFKNKKLQLNNLLKWRILAEVWYGFGFPQDFDKY
jgi:hypothetical protein